MLNLPANFKNDIQGRDTALVPFVFIGAAGTDYIILSTNSGDVAGFTALPLLLNIPSLKESIDIEKRNYKISSVTLDISNYEYNGKRFSELVGNNSLINKECRIFWGSPSVGNVHFKDMHDYQDNSALQIYYGTIRRYTHDDEKVRLVVEDRSQATLHKDLPLEENYLGTGEGIPDKYKGKPKPMVYGHVDRSPCVLERRDKILIDTEIVTGNNPINNFGNAEGTLWAYVGDNYINVVKDNQYTYNETDDGSLNDNKIMLNTSNADMFGIPETGESIGDGFLLCRDSSSNFTITLSNALESPDGITEDFDFPAGSLMKTIDGIDADNPVSWQGNRTVSDEWWSTLTSADRQNNLVVFYDSNAGNLGIDFRAIYRVNYGDDFSSGIELLLLKLGFNFIPSYDHDGFPALIGLNINGHVMKDHLPYYITGSTYGGNQASVFQTHQSSGHPSHGNNFDLIGGLSSNYNMFPVLTNHPDYNGTTSDTLYHWFNFVDVAGATGNTNPDAAFQISIGQTTVGTGLYSSLDLDGSNIKEIELLREVKALKFLDYKYYANVNGRTNIGGVFIQDSPQIIMHIIAEISDISFGSILSQAMEDDIYSDYPLDSWKYAFTVDKKINSKKLIEGIASASPFIPRFNNMGEFKFDVIPEGGGTVTSDDHHIKEADVIDFSFSRTKIEDVKSRIILKYNWDYARGEFNDSVDAQVDDFDELVDYKLDYYGFSDHVELIIDGQQGKYIRNPDTAQKFADWFLMWSCQQKLKLKIKLGLKYMNLEIGDLVDFDAILGGGVKPYGINYVADDDGSYSEAVNGQTIYPTFLITSTNKTLEWVEIETIMMHDLTGTASIRTTFEADVHYDVIASSPLNGVSLSNLFAQFPELEYLYQIYHYYLDVGQGSWSIGDNAMLVNSVWLGSLTDLVGGDRYKIKFSQATTTNLFQLDD